MEHLTLSTPMDIDETCACVRDALGLPPMLMDAENETSWGWVVVDGIEYNVSRPYEPGTLQRWDDTVPPGCDVGITVIFKPDHPRLADLAALERWIATDLIPDVARKLAAAFGTSVHYHRTWLGPGQNVPRVKVFPAPARGDGG